MYDHLGNPGPTPWARVGVHVDHSVDLRGLRELRHRSTVRTSRTARPPSPTWTATARARSWCRATSTTAASAIRRATSTTCPGSCDWTARAGAGSGFDWTVLPAAEPGSGPAVAELQRHREQRARTRCWPTSTTTGASRSWSPPTTGGSTRGGSTRPSTARWPFDVPGSGIRFASEPAVADLDNDGQAEVIFTSWGEKAGNTRRPAAHRQLAGSAAPRGQPAGGVRQSGTAAWPRPRSPTSTATRTSRRWWARHARA